MAVFHLAMAYNDVPAGERPGASVVVAPTLDGNAIVASIEDTIFNQHILTGLGVASVIVRPMTIESDTAHHNVFRHQRMKQPEGGIVQCDPFYQYAVALIELYELRAQLVPFGKDTVSNGGYVLLEVVQLFLTHQLTRSLVFSRCARTQFPPVVPRCLSVQCAFTRHGYVLLPVSIDEWREAHTVNTFPTGWHLWSIVCRIGRELQCSPLFDMQVDIGKQMYGRRVIFTGRNHHTSSSDTMAIADSATEFVRNIFTRHGLIVSHKIERPFRK